MASKKIFKVTESRYRNGNVRTWESVGTMDELNHKFANVLKSGKSCENRKGNKKINVNPRSISSLVHNLEKAEANMSEGPSFSSNWYEGEEMTD